MVRTKYTPQTPNEITAAVRVAAALITPTINKTFDDYLTYMTNDARVLLWKPLVTIDAVKKFVDKAIEEMKLNPNDFDDVDDLERYIYYTALLAYYLAFDAELLKLSPKHRDDPVYKYYISIFDDVYEDFLQNPKF